MKDRKEKLKELLTQRHGIIEKVGYLPFGHSLTPEQVDVMDVVSLEKDGDQYKGLGALPSIYGVQLLFQFVVNLREEEAQP